jgi:murein L,D-transpeptidase YcbB/YkuD
MYLHEDLHDLPLEEKVKRELEVTRFYLDYFGKALEGGQSTFTPSSLLIYSLRMGSLVYGFNAIVKELLEKEDLALSKKGPFVPGGEGLAPRLKKALSSDEDLEKIYARLAYQPVWLGRDGYARRAEELVALVRNDPTLDGDDRIVKEAEALTHMALPRDEEGLARREIRWMRLYRDYARHHLFGAIDWDGFQKKLREEYPNGAWIHHEVLASAATLLVASINGGSLDRAFTYSKPPFAMYDLMLDALKKYREIARSGGWDKLDASVVLRPGMRHPVAGRLRERLTVEGDYNATETSVRGWDLYDGELVTAVKRFQKRHGLDADGIVGKKTWQRLNVPVEEKIEKLKLNIDRLKWLKRGKDRYHILVNIPSFTLYLYDGMEPILRMRVVVGKKGHETPIFYNRVKYITLNPYWRIPASIIRDELVPKLVADREYLKKRHIEVHTGPSVKSPLVDPETVDWKKYLGKVPPYYFMQSPGTFNALGKIKYLFPNEFAVYMHDTPAKSFFARTYRAFSHGCVRLAEPVSLLKKYADIDNSLDYEKALKILEGNERTRLYLKRRIPLDFIYLTAWATRDGTVEFRDDLYGYDALQMSK